MCRSTVAANGLETQAEAKGCGARYKDHRQPQHCPFKSDCDMSDAAVFASNLLDGWGCRTSRQVVLLWGLSGAINIVCQTELLSRLYKAQIVLQPLCLVSEWLQCCDSMVHFRLLCMTTIAAMQLTIATLVQSSSRCGGWKHSPVHAAFCTKLHCYSEGAWHRCHSPHAITRC